jgi:predicted LPLAT superfamily acyltransferase
MKLALVIPNYNHSAAIARTLDSLSPLQLPCFLIDDGSNDQTRFLLQQLAAKHPWVTLLHHPYNRGKGAAVMTGLRAAHAAGFSHALQVDADGQHDLNDIPAMIAMAEEQPQALISGLPQYDDSVPKARLYGRYLTHFWVWVETLSFEIQDSMCGFRIYPLAATEKLLRENVLGERMDFDIEILVKLHWQGVRVLHQPTKVIYPEDGVSHFQGIRDNLRISAMHTRLCFGMLRRLSARLLRHGQSPHWAKMSERGSYWGIRLIAEAYRLGAHWLCRALMYPIVLYFFLTGKASREASLDFLRRVKRLEPAHPQLGAEIGWRDSLRQFFAFGNAALDRFDAWCSRIKLTQVEFPDKAMLSDQLATGRGAVLLASHLGNIELCRAISIHRREIKVNVMVFTQHAENFNRVLRQLNPDSGLNLIQVTEMGPALAMLLQQKVDGGELVVIAADRTSAQSPGRVCYAPFLGEAAPFPQGPFILAGLLDCPVFTMFCLQERRQSGQERYRVYLEPFDISLEGPRAERAGRIQQAALHYSARLEHYARKAPLQWFNFFDFWRPGTDSQVANAQAHRPETRGSATQVSVSDRISH